MLIFNSLLPTTRWTFLLLKVLTVTRDGGGCCCLAVCHGFGFVSVQQMWEYLKGGLSYLTYYFDLDQSVRLWDDAFICEYFRRATCVSSIIGGGKRGHSGRGAATDRLANFTLAPATKLHNLSQTCSPAVCAGSGIGSPIPLVVFGLGLCFRSA